YAIYRTARPENRPVIKGLLLSGVLVSVVTGISEPIEFLFLFIAPVLYAFHIVMSGLALMVTPKISRSRMPPSVLPMVTP
ncbi:PTS transporter subunit EIIC, partial [Xanthomonas citri pv. citri]|nr:PTS transporter subunit EIIC [Xanthomonas citri pv. citri]